MIFESFESLAEAADRGELILVEGSLCHWHLRRDGQLTIHEIIVLPGHRSLDELKRTEGARSIFAKCPIDLESANAWYASRGFTCEGTETTRTGRKLILWRLVLSEV